MSAENDSNGRPPQAPSVLANLPRTRPQRASARRAAARRTGEREVAVKTQMSAAAKAAPARAKAGKAAPKAARPAAAGSRAAAAPNKPAAPRSAPAARRRKPVLEPVPRQGYESADERSATGAIAPPGAAELIASAAEIFGELAKAGVGGGERLLRELLGRVSG